MDVLLGAMRAGRPALYAPDKDKKAVGRKQKAVDRDLDGKLVSRKDARHAKDAKKRLSLRAPCVLCAFA
jgi:hypothetical protein